MMRILITGCSGYVGGILSEGLKETGNLIGLDSRPSGRDMESYVGDISDFSSLISFSDIKPDLIIHAAGNKDISFCESNQDDAMRSNCGTVMNICRAFPDSRIVYLSTDYVFDGVRGNYSENSTPLPTTAYGKSKLCGEVEGFKLAGDRFCVLRIAALYDLNAQFLRFLLNTLSVGKPVDCFNDAVYTPTYFKDFLSGLSSIAKKWPKTNRFLHISGAPLTRFDFAKTFAECFNFNPSLVLPVKSPGVSRFVFPNLSLNSQITERLLNVNITDTKTALIELKRWRE